MIIEGKHGAFGKKGFESFLNSPIKQKSQQQLLAL
jgi:hypothetical protein